MNNEPILHIDGYKLDHKRQYPEGTTRVYSNWTPRGSRVPGQNKVVFFGLQYFLDQYITENFDKDFFSRPLEQVAEKYVNAVNRYLGPNSIGVTHITDLHKLGYLPLEFKALKEGTLCDLRVPMLTVENTDGKFFWLVNYFETLLSSALWMPCTSATTAYRMRNLLDTYAHKTGGDLSLIHISEPTRPCGTSRMPSSA